MSQTVKIEKLAVAARSRKVVKGLTHDFYRYPARFSPQFAKAAIELFSDPGCLILDPFMGGGTTILEAMALGRDSIGTDINSLSVFITKVKTTIVSKSKLKKLKGWFYYCIEEIDFRTEVDTKIYDDSRTKNLHISKARYLKKYIGCLLNKIGDLPTKNARDFARCVILRSAQWALDGRKQRTSIRSFKAKLLADLSVMIECQMDLHKRRARGAFADSKVFQCNAGQLEKSRAFLVRKADLVVCSPPYPGVHVLYHRWQVDGRKESPAPYWIADCQDGHAEPYYTFGPRQQRHLRTYFENAGKAFSSIRKVVKDKAIVIQMIAFSKPQSHLKRYLNMMNDAGFREIGLEQSSRRIWRQVPNRKWHANLKGPTSGSREVVLIHEAC